MSKQAYRFHIRHRPDEKTIQVMLWEEGTLLLDTGKVTDTSNSTLLGGRLGVFCYSQKDVTFSALSYRYKGLFRMITRPGVDKVKPKVWFKYFLLGLERIWVD